MDFNTHFLPGGMDKEFEMTVTPEDGYDIDLKLKRSYKRLKD